jgi:hypothetical protein
MTQTDGATCGADGVDSEVADGFATTTVAAIEGGRDSVGHPVDATAGPRRSTPDRASEHSPNRVTSKRPHRTALVPINGERHSTSASKYLLPVRMSTAADARPFLDSTIVIRMIADTAREM